MTFREVEIKINQLVAKDEIEEAISLLSTYFAGQEMLKDILAQSGRYHALIKDHRNGVVDYLILQRQLNQLRLNILNFLEELKAAKTSNEDMDRKAGPQKKGVAGEFRSALATTAVLLLLKKEQEQGEGLTITEMHRRSGVKNRKYIFAAVEKMETYGLVRRNKKGKINYWTLSEEGVNLAAEFEQTLRGILPGKQ